MTHGPTITPVPASGEPNSPTGRGRHTVETLSLAGTMQVRAAEERVDRALPQQVRRARAQARARPARRRLCATQLEARGGG